MQATAVAARPMRVLFIDEYLPQEMLGLMWLSRAIKDGGHQTKALFIPDKDWLEKIKAYDPDVVCYSVTTGMHLYFADINRKVREVAPRALSVFGGPHPTFSPEYVETDGIDVGMPRSPLGSADKTWAEADVRRLLRMVDGGDGA